MDGSPAVSYSESQNAEFQNVAALPGWRPIDYLSASKMFSSLEETTHEKAVLKVELRAC
jgi:hypothetical protein